MYALSKSASLVYYYLYPPVLSHTVFVQKALCMCIILIIPSYQYSPCTCLKCTFPVNMPDLTEAFWLQPVMQKPAWIQSGWSGQVLAKCIWSGSQLVCKNHWAQFWHKTTGLLPGFHFQIQLRSFTDGPDHSVQNQPKSDLMLAECVRFWPNGSGLELEASQCARLIWLMCPS